MSALRDVTRAARSAGRQYCAQLFLRLAFAAALRALGWSQVRIGPVKLVLFARFVRKADRLCLGLDRDRTFGHVRLLHAREEHEDLFAWLHRAGEDVSGADLKRLRLFASRDLQLFAGLVVEVDGERAEQDLLVRLVDDAE